MNRYIIFALSLLFCTVSCKKQECDAYSCEPVKIEYEGDEYVVLSTELQYIPSNTGRYTIEVYASTKWSVVDNADWLESSFEGEDGAPTPAPGATGTVDDKVLWARGNGKIIIKAGLNETSAQRVAVITATYYLTSGERRVKTLSIVQAPH